MLCKHDVNEPMTFTKARFASFEEYLRADPSDLPEGRCEYWDGELIPVMSEAFENGTIAIFVQLALIAIGVSFRLIRPICEVEVPGRPQSRIPDLTVTDEVHVTLLKKRSTITRRMPPPRLVIEVVSPGSENSENYIRDYQNKRDQYAAIGIPEYWIIDPQREWVMVGTLTLGQYEFATFRKNDTICSPTFPALNLTAAQVLEG
jgi:Uma2 family endonuclease